MYALRSGGCFAAYQEARQRDGVSSSTARSRERSPAPYRREQGSRPSQTLTGHVTGQLRSDPFGNKSGRYGTVNPSSAGPFYSQSIGDTAPLHTHGVPAHCWNHASFHEPTRARTHPEPAVDVRPVQLLVLARYQPCLVQRHLALRAFSLCSANQGLPCSQHHTPNAGGFSAQPQYRKQQQWQGGLKCTF